MSKLLRGATALAVVLLAAAVATGCGVTRGEDPSGLHRLRMMVPNSPGGGYDLTARTAVKIMEDDDITGRVEVFNVIGAGGTVAMARLMNEKGNGDLMMTMGLGVVGATYTNGSKARASDATGGCSARPTCRSSTRARAGRAGSRRSGCGGTTRSRHLRWWARSCCTGARCGSGRWPSRRSS